MVSADTARDVGRSEASMLGIYLNDHLAGATAASNWPGGWPGPA